MLAPERKMNANKYVGYAAILALCLTTTSCARVVVKVLSFGADDTSSQHENSAKAEQQEVKKKTPVETAMYTTQLGDKVSLRFPSSIFFINDTANSLPNYHQNMDDLVEVIRRYPHNLIQVNVNFQVSGDNHVAVEVASNQARYFTSTLTQHIQSGFTTSDGNTVLRSNILNHEYDAIGNFIEVVLQ